MKPKSVIRISREKLAETETRALLAYLGKLRGLPDHLDEREWSAGEIKSVAPGIAQKTDARWQAAWADVKQELTQREHVERPGRGQTPKDARRIAQQTKQNR